MPPTEIGVVPMRRPSRRTTAPEGVDETRSSPLVTWTAAAGRWGRSRGDRSRGVGSRSGCSRAGRSGRSGATAMASAPSSTSVDGARAGAPSWGARSRSATWPVWIQSVVSVTIRPPGETIRIWRWPSATRSIQSGTAPTESPSTNTVEPAGLALTHRLAGVSAADPEPTTPPSASGTSSPPPRTTSPTMRATTATPAAAIRAIGTRGSPSVERCGGRGGGGGEGGARWVDFS